MHRRVALLSAAALVVAGALVPSGTAQAGASAGLDPRPVRWTATDSWSERRNVQQYWTSQRMLAAQPLSSPTPRRGTQSSGPTQGSPWATQGASTTTTRRTPWTTRGASAATQGSPWSVRGTAAVSTQQQALVPNSPGLRWTDGGAVVRTTGRVFFTTADGQNSSCSGSAVTSANESVVITAGHCVKLNGAAHRNWVFVPAFDNGRRPFGTWVAARMLTTQQWNASEDINFDVAAVVVAPLQGRTLTDVVGGQGVAFNQPRRRQMFSFGYPAAAPFDGSRLIYCSGRAFDDTVQTRDLGLRCNMTGGSSGGPWFQGFDESTGLGWLNSVNSFKYDFAQNFMFGPFFGNEAMSVYQAAQNSDAT
ncbi:trypsin-like serine peptidase [Nonomuraea basaltis]|uniref:trypsin-like serine peptidase n=1 Tax=Nonomuraea basaltis TaxID=2495887 RepID=UPI00110C4FFB|nr:peptidase [Nonomuraea basaltis]TMR99825.1 peptidase [Nonomuraea basaltis]